MFRRCLILFSLVATGLHVQAIDFVSTNLYRVAEDRTVVAEQWVVADIVLAEGYFQRDLFAASADKIRLDGSFAGDVWGCTGFDAEMSGRCARNLRLAGKTIRINGIVEGNLIALAETLIIGTNTVVGGEARLFGMRIVQEGEIKGDVHIAAAHIATLGGTVGGSVRVVAPDILFSRNTRIAGGLSYTAGKEIFPEEGMVGGTLERIEPQTPSLVSGSRLIGHATWFLAALLAGIPFIAVFPLTTSMATQLARNAPWKCLFVGFFASMAFPILGVICISSFVGIPLGSMLLALWGILVYVSRIIVGLVVGLLVLKAVGTTTGKVFSALALGLAIIYLATFFPFVGLPVQLTVVWLGMGSLILSMIQKRRFIIHAPEELSRLEALKNNQNKSKEDSP